jgi:hypothetical protein
VRQKKFVDQANFGARIHKSTDSSWLTFANAEEAIDAKMFFLMRDATKVCRPPPHPDWKGSAVSQLELKKYFKLTMTHHLLSHVGFFSGLLTRRP